MSFDEICIIPNNVIYYKYIDVNNLKVKISIFIYSINLQIMISVGDNSN